MSSESVIVRKGQNPGCLIQLLWFVLIGWWVGQIWVAVAWFLNATIIGIPLGILMLNKVPLILALRPETEALMVLENGGVRHVDTPQEPLLLRALWFVFIGWWLSGIWIEVAYLLCATIIGLPLGFWMFDRVPAIVSLRRY